MAGYSAFDWEETVPYDPEVHHRRSVRYPGHDYAQDGAYFVTVCAYLRVCIFGDIIDAEFAVNDLGGIAFACWNAIPDHFPHVALDAFVLMPNHLHGVLFIGGVADTSDPPDPPVRGDGGQRPRGPSGRSLGAIVGSFKAAAARQINERRETPGAPVWHRNYHDRIVRNDRELNAIRWYVYNNPAAWAHDDENPAVRQHGRIGDR